MLPYFSRTALFFCSLLITMPAQADCTDEIREIFQLKSTQTNVRSIIETSIGGKVMQTTKGWVLDYQHNMFEVVGRNWWSMTSGGYHYNSNDGKVWTKSAAQDPDWEEKAAAARENILSTMTNTACSETEEIDGKSYRVLRYSHEAKMPYATKTDNILYFDPEDRFVYRTIAHNKLESGGTVVTTYTRDETIVFPKVE
jgi:hypothetical protein